jgi:hypothetical protein
MYTTYARSRARKHQKHQSRHPEGRRLSYGAGVAGPGQATTVTVTKSE